MLMKQQDRLEEREQDIEEQLYKLESDKRLVEVTSASPCHGQSQGLSPFGTMGTSSWDAGAWWAGRKAGMQGRSSWTDFQPPFQCHQSSFGENKKSAWSCSAASWALG